MGLEGAAWFMRSWGWRAGTTASTCAAIALGGVVLLQGLSGAITAVAGSAVVFSAALGVVSGALSALAMGTTIERLLMKRKSKGTAIAIALFTAVVGTSLGLGLGLKLAGLGALQLFGMVGLALIVVMLHQQLRNSTVVFSHQSEGFLIKP